MPDFAERQGFGTSISVDDFYALAKSYNLPTPNSNSENELPTETRPLSVSDIDTIQKDPPFMINPLFREGEIIVMSGEAKVGKTYFAIDLSLMCATGSFIENCLSSEKSHKVLYLDTEMNKNVFDNRVRKIRKLYENIESSVIDSNFKRHCITGKKNKFNIETESGRDEIDKLIRKEDPKIIVLDNLGGFLSYGAERSDKIWETVSNWLKKVVSHGRTVIIVHHFTKKKQERGTRKIIDDADLAISLKKPDNNDIPKTRTVIDFSIDYARNLYGEQLTPFTLEYISKAERINRQIVMTKTESDHTSEEEHHLQKRKYQIPDSVATQFQINDIQNEILNVIFEHGDNVVTMRILKADESIVKTANGAIKKPDDGKITRKIRTELQNLINKKLVIGEGETSNKKYSTSEMLKNSISQNES